VGRPGEPDRRGDGGLLVVNISWPRQEVYDPSDTPWFLQYFAVIFVALTLVVGFLAYRVVKDRDGAPDPVDALVEMKK
jgi:hypothetical protein